MEIRRCDHHRVDPVHREEILVGREQLRLPTEPFLHHAVGLLTVDAPRIGQGDDFKISRGKMLVDALHVRRTSAVATANHADSDPVISSDRAGSPCGGERVLA